MTRPADQIVALHPAATYEAAEVALIVFHVTARTFRRRLKKLRCEGFPAPVSQWGVKVWSGQALIDWQNRSPSLSPNVLPFGVPLAERARNAARQGARNSTMRPA